MRVLIDRPLGAAHPRHPGLVYPVNYGSLPGTVSGDGEPIDAYLLGPDQPLAEGEGTVVAIVERLDDREDKLVAAAEGHTFTAPEIAAAIDFQERFFQTRLRLLAPSTSATPEAAARSEAMPDPAAGFPTPTRGAGERARCAPSPASGAGYPGSIDEIVAAQAAGCRLDAYLVRALPNLAPVQVQRLLALGLIRVDGETAEGTRRLGGRERIAGAWRLLNPGGVEPEPLPLDVRYEDADLLVVEKPAGMVVHPALGHWSGTLANAVMGHWFARGEPANRLGLVQRLDRGTSGLLVIGKHAGAARALSRQIASRRLQRRYLTLAVGPLDPGVSAGGSGSIDLPLARDPANRFRSRPDPAGQPACTRYRTVRTLPGHTLLDLELETGRTHQIRAHLAAIGHPIAGDTLYGAAPLPCIEDRHFLHAHRLAFAHPVSGAPLSFESPLPGALRRALATAAAAGEAVGSIDRGRLS